MNSKKLSWLRYEVSRLTLLKQQLEQEITNLKELKKAELRNMAEENKRKAQDYRNELISTQKTLSRETENMLEVHNKLKSRFFAPTPEQVERFEVDIPTFLKEYCKTGIIKDACAKTNALTPITIKYLEKTDPMFKEDFDIAKAIFAELVSDEATTRALHGTETPIIFRGEVTSYEKMPDNRLLETVLKAQLPHLYDRKSLDRIPNADRPQINVNIVNFADDPSSIEASDPLSDGEVIDVENNTEKEN